ncbi:Hypothetical predicted protein, partial [Marmota monax]
GLLGRTSLSSEIVSSGYELRMAQPCSPWMASISEFQMLIDPEWNERLTL